MSFRVFYSPSVNLIRGKTGARREGTNEVSFSKRCSVTENDKMPCARMKEKAARAARTFSWVLPRMGR